MLEFDLSKQQATKMVRPANWWPCHDVDVASTLTLYLYRTSPSTPRTSPHLNLTVSLLLHFILGAQRRTFTKSPLPILNTDGCRSSATTGAVKTGLGGAAPLKRSRICRRPRTLALQSRG